MTIDSRELRTALGHFTTGVTVVSCRTDDGIAHGATVNAFTAVSLDPPLVLVSLSRRSRLCRLLENRPFTVNVLHADQRDLALHFAGNPCLDRIPWTDERTPGLSDCLASVSCTPWRHYDGGDHVLYLGEVREFRTTGGRPLVFHIGQFHQLHAAA
ncbi:MAG TPA: flavin reductase family protein [Amycolatopsis sp.]|jgi:flavin reductase (DIM6/NTAB) family NADH-FMN oxidoreductase RutF|nr:flavin reductase family protein [Amycolatopsis sp.]